MRLAKACIPLARFQRDGRSAERERSFSVAVVSAAPVDGPEWWGVPQLLWLADEKEWSGRGTSWSSGWRASRASPGSRRGPPPGGHGGGPPAHGEDAGGTSDDAAAKRPE